MFISNFNEKGYGRPDKEICAPFSEPKDSISCQIGSNNVKLCD